MMPKSTDQPTPFTSPMRSCMARQHRNFCSNSTDIMLSVRRRVRVSMQSPGSAAAKRVWLPLDHAKQVMRAMGANTDQLKSTNLSEFSEIRSKGLENSAMEAPRLPGRGMNELDSDRTRTDENTRKLQRDLWNSCRAGSRYNVHDVLQAAQAQGGSDLRKTIAMGTDPDHGATPLHALCEAAQVQDGEHSYAFENSMQEWQRAASIASQQLMEYNTIGAVFESVAAHELSDGPACAIALVASGASCNAPAANGSTPLHWAAGAGCRGLVRFLLACGADPLAQSYTWRRQVFGRGSGQLPLHWAAESGHSDCVDELLGVDARAVQAAGGSIPALEMIEQEQEKEKEKGQLDEEQDEDDRSHTGRLVAGDTLQGKLGSGLNTDESHVGPRKQQADVARTDVSGLRVADLSRWWVEGEARLRRLAAAVYADERGKLPSDLARGEAWMDLSDRMRSVEGIKVACLYVEEIEEDIVGAEVQSDGEAGRGLMLDQGGIVLEDPRRRYRRSGAGGVFDLWVGDVNRKENQATVDGHGTIRCRNRLGKVVPEVPARTARLELAKRLRLGMLAGSLQMREYIARPDGVLQLGTPLKAARAGGHDECVKVLQYAANEGGGN